MHLLILTNVLRAWNGRPQGEEKMKKIILGTLLATSTVFAQREVELTKQCEKALKTQAVQAEAAKLKADGEVFTKLRGDVQLSYSPVKPDMVVRVIVEDRTDGRFASYRAKVLKTDALQCKIPIVRSGEGCRYSADDGPKSLNKIKGISFKNGKTIKPEDSLTELEQQQIRAVLVYGDEGASVPELIRQTDDGELSTGNLTLPAGRKLTYYGAYGGDNPYGTFFEEGTATVAGDNGDGSICIQYKK